MRQSKVQVTPRRVPFHDRGPITPLPGNRSSAIRRAARVVRPGRSCSQGPARPRSAHFRVLDGSGELREGLCAARAALSDSRPAQPERREKQSQGDAGVSVRSGYLLRRGADAIHAGVRGAGDVRSAMLPLPWPTHRPPVQIPKQQSLLPLQEFPGRSERPPFVPGTQPRACAQVCPRGVRQTLL